MVIGDVNGDGKAELFWLIGHMSGDMRGPVYTDDGTGSLFGISRLSLAHGLIGQIGDVNGDGYGDLVTGSYDDTVTDPSAAHVGGEVEVLYGGPDGITSGQTPQVLSQDTADVPGAAEQDDAFGAAVHLTDLTDDGKAEVVVGIPGEDTAGCNLDRPGRCRRTVRRWFHHHLRRHGGGDLTRRGPAGLGRLPHQPSHRRVNRHPSPS